MNKLNNFKDSSCEKNDCQKDNQINHENNRKLDKILCHHCGRTSSNGIRCLGICVEDNEY